MQSYLTFSPKCINAKSISHICSIRHKIQYRSSFDETKLARIAIFNFTDLSLWSGYVDMDCEIWVTEYHGRLKLEQQWVLSPLKGGLRTQPD